MKIGLVDVDGKHFAKKNGGRIYPNIALGKIARWHKEQGDEVEWASPLFDYDIVYMSKIFNFSTDDSTIYQAKYIQKGGTGYDIHSVLPTEIDRLQPDYSIYPNVPQDTAYGFLTRGCPNKCPWCVVPKKEGAIRPYMDIDEIAIEGRKKVVLMDNNILAAGDYAVEQMTKIIAKGYRVDFNQALDARRINDTFAKLLAKIKWIDRRIRFGCDTTAQIADCEKAIEMINAYGYKGEYFLYTMIGGKNDFDECYNRLNHWWRRNRENRAKHLPGVYPYVQPYRDPYSRNHVIPQWQKDMAQWVNKHQIFQLTDFEHFSPRKGFVCSQYCR